MIRKILTTYAARLDEYLARSHRHKLVVSLVNLEREASGDGGYMQRAATGYAGRRQPCNLVDIGAIGSAKTALQATAGPFSQNRLLLGQRLHPLSGTTAAAESASLLRMKPAGSIGLRGGSYCRRASSARGWQAGSRQRTICCNRHRPFSRYNCDSAPLRQQSSRAANPAEL